MSERDWYKRQMSAVAQQLRDAASRFDSAVETDQIEEAQHQLDNIQAEFWILERNYASWKHYSN